MATHAEEPNRRDFLIIAGNAFAAVGAAAAIWPFIAQMNPDAGAQALASVEVDLAPVKEGQAITVMWRGKPIFIRNRTKQEVDEIIRWLTGHSQTSLDRELEKRTSFRDFFAEAPKLNPARALITGVVCGVRVEKIEDPLMRELRYLDKLIDELAKGKKMDKILRQAGD